MLVFCSDTAARCVGAEVPLMPVLRILARGPRSSVTINMALPMNLPLSPTLSPSDGERENPGKFIGTMNRTKGWRLLTELGPAPPSKIRIRCRLCQGIRGPTAARLRLPGCCD